MFSLRVEGWREINHSYALVNQYQLLQLKKYRDIALCHADLPLFNPEWNALRNGAGFSEAQQAEIRSIASARDEPVDAVYRLGYPFHVYGADAKRAFVFMTSENHRFYPQDVYQGPEAARSYSSGPPRIVTPSSWSRDGLALNGFADAAVIPHGVDTAVFYPAAPAEREAQRAALGIREHEVAFLNVSAMSFNKGVDLLVVAFCHLRERYRHVVLILKDQSNLYGGTAAALVQDLARQLPRLVTKDALAGIRIISDNLDLARLRVLYSAADAYATPYRAEGFNMPPLEAAACGTPVIMTQGGSSEDYFDPSFALHTEAAKMSSDELGVYLEPSLEHLVANMEAIVQNRATELDAGKGRAWVAEHFSWDKVVRRLVGVLRRDE